MVCNSNVDANAYLLSLCIRLTLILKERKPSGKFSVSVIRTELSTISLHITQGKTSLLKMERRTVPLFVFYTSPV